MKNGILCVLIAVVSCFIGVAIGHRIRIRTDGRQVEHKVPDHQPNSKPNLRSEGLPAKESGPVSPSPTAPQVESDATDNSSPRLKVIDLLRGVLSEDKVFWALRNAVLQDPLAQKGILEELMTTADPHVMEAARECLYGLKDPELARRIVDSVSGEMNADRKASLAFVMSMNLHFDFVRSSYEAILGSSDARLVESAIGRMCIQNVDAYRDFTMRVIPRLRELSVQGETPALREAATSALMGDQSQEGVSFLEDRLLNDPDPRIQSRALYALPIAYGMDSRKLPDQIRPWITVAFDVNRSDEIRRFAADRILMVTSDIRFTGLITDEQRATLKRMIHKSP